MKAWWQSKSLSEQRWLIVLMLFLGLTMTVYGVVMPLNNTITAQRLELKKIQNESAWLEEQTLAAGIVATKRTGKPLDTLVQTSAKAAGLTIELKQEGNHSVVISGNDIALPALVQWLEQLRASQGIYPLEMAFDASKKGTPFIVLQALRLTKAGRE